MSVPLDKLYDFVDRLCGGDIIIYRFYPHGSKKITDLHILRPQYPEERFSQVPVHGLPFLYDYMICHDQEPLDFQAYDGYENFQKVYDQRFQNNGIGYLCYSTADAVDKKKNFIAKQNLKVVIPGSWYKPCLLLHSEKNSENLARYQQSGFIGVYWWSHGIIARDWFRFAEHDSDLHKKQLTRDFLVYNRAWSGTREYRLKFAELIAQHGLHNNCVMKFAPIDDELHYRQHAYRNLDFAIHTPLEDYFQLNTHDSNASADYAVDDYINTAIEVVLETLFDDQRLHLTEKTLRPIACGQPFMLVSTPGALRYVREYGFQTFSPLIDETYDTVQDPVARLTAVVNEMRRIAGLPQDQKHQLFDGLRAIARHNQQRFFSAAFHDQIVQEFQNNLVQARGHLVDI